MSNTINPDHLSLVIGSFDNVKTNALKKLPDNLLDPLKSNLFKLASIEEVLGFILTPLTKKELNSILKKTEKIRRDLENIYSDFQRHRDTIGTMYLSYLYNSENLKHELNKFSIKEKKQTASQEQNNLILELIINISLPNNYYTSLNEMTADQIKTRIHRKELTPFLIFIASRLKLKTTQDALFERLKATKKLALKNINTLPSTSLQSGKTEKTSTFTIKHPPLELNFTIKRTYPQIKNYFIMNINLAGPTNFKLKVHGIDTNAVYLSGDEVDVHYISPVTLTSDSSEQDLLNIKNLDYLSMTKSIGVILDNKTFWTSTTEVYDSPPIISLIKALFSQHEKDFTITWSKKRLKTLDNTNLLSSDCLAPLIKSFIKNDPKYILEYEEKFKKRDRY